MKVNIQKLVKRLFPLWVAFFVLLLCVAVPTYALADPIPWNYMDYVTDVVVDGENDIVSFDVPKDFTFITVYNNAIGYREVSYNGKLEGQFPQGAQWYSSYVNPIDSRHPLSVKNIPEGATLTVETRVTIPTQNTIEWSTTTAKVNVIYMNDEWEDVYVDSFGATFAPMMTIPIDIKHVDGATSLTILFWFPDIYAYLMNDYSYTVEISRIHCEMAISSLYRLPEVTQQNSKLMTQINEKLDEQGVLLEDLMKEQEITNDKLDDIINGTPEQNEAADKFNDDVNNAVGDLEDAGNALDQLEKPDISVDQLFPTDILGSDGFYALTAVLSKFWQSDVLTSILLMMGGLMLVSYVLFGEKG